MNRLQSLPVLEVEIIVLSYLNQLQQVAEEKEVVVASCDARGFRSYQVPARIKIVLVIALVETAKCALLSRGSNKGSDCRPTPRGLVDTNSLFFDLASGSIGL